MPSDSLAQGVSTDRTEVLTTREGRYLYCVADSGEEVSLGAIGIDDSLVYTIPYREIGAVVHQCVAEPYQSADREVVHSWVLAHQRVVDRSWEKWDTVLPLRFDSVVSDKDGITAEENVRNWLKNDYDSLRSRLEKLRGKAEYGVQIFWTLSVIVPGLMKASSEITQLEAEVRSQSRGAAYLYRQKLEQALKRELAAQANQCFRDLYERLRRQVDDVVVAKTKPGDQNTQMIMNLSCLLPRDQFAALEEELEKINSTEGFSARFSGPWPPYSFVGTG